MKKYVIISLVLAFCSLLVLGCQNVSSETVDEQFMKSLSTGLEARWKLSEDPNNQNFEEGTTKHREFDSKLVDAELSELVQYESKIFEDEDLRALALEYIGLLNTQKNALDYVVADFEQYEKIWLLAYDNRSQLITEFVNEYDLEVSDKYIETLNDMIMNAEKVTRGEQEVIAVEEMLLMMEFVVIDDSFGLRKYQCIAENTSGIDFTEFDLTINLINNEDIILETTYASVANWSIGQKASFEFTTDKEFVTVELMAIYAVE